jgi:molybdate transport system regulatory protein
MKTSARNQFKGTISVIHSGAVNDEIELTLPGGDRIVAVVTRESSQRLGLTVGGTAIALVKAPWVLLVTEEEDIQFSARNHFQGTVHAIHAGAVNAEVVVSLEGGAQLVAIVTRESCDGLGLKVGQPVSAIFKASSVILATPKSNR